MKKLIIICGNYKRACVLYKRWVAVFSLLRPTGITEKMKVDDVKMTLYFPTGLMRFVTEEEVAHGILSCYPDVETETGYNAEKDVETLEKWLGITKNYKDKSCCEHAIKEFVNKLTRRLNTIPQCHFTLLGIEEEIEFVKKEMLDKYS